MRYALMLTLLFAVAALGTTRAQEARAHSSIGEDATVISESMTLHTFAERRRNHLSTINRIRKSYGKDRRTFSTWARFIAPERRAAILAYWRNEKEEARNNRHSFWKRKNETFHRSLRWSANQFGVSFGWLHSCDHHEGSDRMVWNGGVVDPGLKWYPYGPPGSSGAYGPMQFMEGTFEGFARRGMDWLRSHKGIRVNRDRYHRWNSNLGQAIGAAWGFRHGLDSHWTGAGC